MNKFLPFVALRQAAGRQLQLVTSASIRFLDATEVESDVARALREFTVQGLRPWLLLDATLDAPWHERAWEDELRARGLVRGCSVARRAYVRFGDAVFAPAPESYWVNLFPPASAADGFAFVERFQEAAAQGRLRKVPYDRLGQAAIPACADLFILAHADARGLLDRHGNPMATDWLFSVSLPKRVWLLACNVGGAMYRLAEQLMDRGVRTVVCATAELSAPAMAQIVRQWTAARPHTRLEPWLLEVASEDAVEGGARRLTVLGEFMLDVSKGAPWHEAVWHDGACPDAGALERELEAAPEKFDAALAILGEPTLWPMAYEHMHPIVLRIAENIDHSAMARLMRGGPRRETPDILLALANAAYRKGHYPHAAECLAKTLQSPALPASLHAKALGLLVNVLIDLHFQAAAEKAVAAHERFADAALASTETRLVLDENEFKRLDWKARIAFRNADFDRAIRSMARKLQTSDNPAREIAWLLYFHAWKAHKHGDAVSAEGRKLRDKAIEALEESLASDRLGGNSDVGYLLRALACYAALARDDTARQAVRQHTKIIDDGLMTLDPGPWAFAVLYLAMDQDPWALEQAEHALDALWDAGYFLEGAAFAARLPVKDQASKFMERFDSRRADTLTAFSGIDWLAGEKPTHLDPASILPM